MESTERRQNSGLKPSSDFKASCGLHVRSSLTHGSFTPTKFIGVSIRLELLFQIQIQRTEAAVLAFGLCAPGKLSFNLAFKAAVLLAMNSISLGPPTAQSPPFLVKVLRSSREKPFNSARLP